MKIHSLPEHIAAFIFDIDGTLYSCAAYMESQSKVLIDHLAEVRGRTCAEMAEEVERYRSAWSAAHEGRKMSLGNAFVAFGVSIEESVRWREELIQPEAYLSADPRLRSTLEALRNSLPGGKTRLGVVTNNPASVGRRTLAALGVEALFETVIGLDTCGVSKPHAAPFLRAAADLGAECGSCLAVGDRYDIDIALPLELGMGGVLVDGVEDVYLLPEILSNGDRAASSLRSP